MRKKFIIDYANFRKNFKLKYLPLDKKEDNIYYNGELVEDVDKKYAEGESFINVGYNLKNSVSNLRLGAKKLQALKVCCKA